MKPSTDAVCRALSALRACDLLLLEVVQSSGDEGCHSDELYRLLSHRISLPQFEAWIDSLVGARLLRRSGLRLFVVPRPAPIADADTTRAIRAFFSTTALPGDDR